MKIGSVSYVPPPSYGHPRRFLDNLESYKTRYPLELCSEYQWDCSAKIRQCTSPECVSRSPLWFAKANFAFLESVKPAQLQGWDFMLVLQDDCRIGEDWWDERIFTEFFENGGENAINGGTIMSWFPVMNDFWITLESNNKRILSMFGHPGVITFGLGNDPKRYTDRRAYANGGLSIIRTSIIAPLFTRQDLYVDGHAWDDAIGKWLWSKYGENAYEHIVPLGSVMSDCSDHGTTEDQRKSLLLNHSVAGIHQVKTDWNP